jgi:ParB-like chromosome segregation protein Spo0J
MKIESVSIDAVHLDPKNARKHNEKNLAAIRGSIEQFNQVEPLIVQKSTGKIIGGNGRYAVLKELGHKKVDVVYVDIDNVKATALGLALNRTGELASWDSDFLDQALKDLKEFEFDLGSIGFGDLPTFEFNPPKEETTIESAMFTLKVTFQNEDDQKALFTELTTRGFKVKV